MNKKKNSTTPHGTHHAGKGAKASPDATERARKAGIDATQENIERIEREQGAAPAPVDATASRQPVVERPKKQPKPKASGKANQKKGKGKPEREGPRKVGALDAAAQVLASADKPMRVTEIVAAMAKRNLWKSPGGKTPEATLSAAMGREISKLGKEARFRKHERGLFVLNRRGA